MASLRDIRRRILSVRSTQQITKAMKMVAAAKLRRAQERLMAARPYSYRVTQILGSVCARVDRSLHPLLAEREQRRVGIVAVAGDRGLCGSFNTNIIRRTHEEIARHGERVVGVIAVGRKVRDHFLKQSLPVLGSYAGFFSELAFPHAVAIASLIKEKFLAEELDHVYVVYNEFKSAVQQRIVVEQLLPIQPSLPEVEKHPVEYLFEPSPQEILDPLLDRYLNIRIWHILLESFAAEQGARMTAMDAATENAEEMIQNLVLHYNKARQASITKELIEIVSGAEALKA
ncbi:MAG: ATP synthase F1 subunit gamma [candidate division KSB1 bacterium]|nr:ATP synthase F1 subunit gamma [candidate division KSB1 bacterium]